MNKSETIGKLADALAKAQGAMRHAAKDTKNDFFKSRYADLASVWDACRAHLSANGLCVLQHPEVAGDVMVLHTTIAHASGEWFSSDYPIRPVKTDPQGIGSAITYARRYALAAIVGVASDDDDGESAQGRGASSQAASTPAKPAQQSPAPAPIKTAIKAATTSTAAASEGPTKNDIEPVYRPLVQSLSEPVAKALWKCAESNVERMQILTDVATAIRAITDALGEDRGWQIISDAIDNNGGKEMKPDQARTFRDEIVRISHGEVVMAQANAVDLRAGAPEENPPF